MNATPAKPKTVTFDEHTDHVTIPVERVRTLGLTHLISPSDSRMSFQSVHVGKYDFNSQTSSWDRVKSALQSAGYEVKTRYLSRSGKTSTMAYQRMQYKPEYVEQPFAHGDFLKLVGGQGFVMLIVQDGKFRLCGTGGIHGNEASAASRVVERVPESDIAPHLVERMRRMGKEPTAPQLYEITIEARLPIDANLLAYVTAKRARGEDCVDREGKPAMRFTWLDTHRAARIVNHRIFSSRDIANKISGKTDRSFTSGYSWTAHPVREGS